jgi:hypothetical protein
LTTGREARYCFGIGKEGGFCFYKTFSPPHIRYYIVGKWPFSPLGSFLSLTITSGSLVLGEQRLWKKEGG